MAFFGKLLLRFSTPVFSLGVLEWQQRHVKLSLNQLVPNDRLGRRLCENVRTVYSKQAVDALSLYDDGCLEVGMKRFIEGDNRQQITLLPESLDEYIEAENPVRVVDLFVEQLDLGGLGFSVEPAATGRPSYHPSTLLKLYVYGYLNRIQSSRRLEREAQRNIELIWLLGRLFPDFKTIADFRRDNGEGIRNACRQFIVLCRQLNLFAQAVVAVDGSKFKAVNAHDRNFTRGELEKQEIDRCIERYLTERQQRRLGELFV